MYRESKKAFTMIELVFVIVIIGILAAVAIPRLGATRDDAEVTNARVTVASIRNALSMERQKRILRGDFTVITSVGSGSNVFDKFSADGNGNEEAVLEYPMTSSTTKGHWSLENSETEYKFNSGAANNPTFVISGGRFVCKASSDCSILTN